MTGDDPFSAPGPGRRETRRATTTRHRRRVRHRHAVAALVLAGGVLLGATGALAVFTSTGTGTTTLTLPDPSIDVTAGTATATGLYPGATVTAEVVVVNDGPAPFTVTAVTGAATASPTACPGDAVRLVAPQTLPAMTPSATATLTVGLEMATDAPTGCQDTSFRVPVTVDGRIG